MQIVFVLRRASLVPKGAIVLRPGATSADMYEFFNVDWLPGALRCYVFDKSRLFVLGVTLRLSLRIGLRAWRAQRFGSSAVVHMI